jgi:hypothetical protein
VRPARRYRGLAGGQQPGEPLRLAQRPGLHDLAVGQHDDLVAAAYRGQPVRDDDADPVAQQPLRRPLHAGLGDRVHPRGGLVEDHHVRVAYQDPGERDELLLPGRQHVTALAQPGLHPVGQLGHPGTQAQLAQRAGGRFEQVVVEQGDVLGEGTGEDLGALRHHRDPPAQLLDVQVEHVGTAEEHGAPRHVHRPGQHLRQRGLARAGTPDQRVRAAPREGQAHVLERRPARRVVPERQAVQDQVAVGWPVAARRLLPGVPQQLHPAPGAQRVLQLGHHPADVLDGRAEREREQPDGGEPGTVHAVRDERPDPADHHRRDARPGTGRGERVDPRRHRPHATAAAQHLAGPLRVQAQHVRPGERGTHVVLPVDGLLHHRGQVRPRLLLAHPGGTDAPGLAPQAHEEQSGEQQHAEPGRPPDEQPGDDRQRGQRRRLGDPHAAAAHLGGDLVHVAVDAVEQLAHRGGLQRRQVLPEGDPAQPAAYVGRPVGGQPGRDQAHGEVAQDRDRERRGQHHERREGAVQQERTGQRGGRGLAGRAEHDQQGHERGTPR